MGKKLSQSLRRSYKDAAYYSLMVGLGETYIAAFVLFAGFGSFHSGLISVLPLTIGSLLQIPFVRFVSPYISYRRWVTLNCGLQTVALVGLGLLAFEKGFSVVFLYLFVSLYWASGLIAGVGWNSWMSEYLPDRLRIQFYSRRAKISQLFLFAGILFAGGLLQVSSVDPTEKRFIFAALFLLAAGFRALSTYQISKQHEVKKPAEEKRWYWDKNFFSYLVKGDKPLVISYVFLLHTTVNLAAPFFNPYMLQNLQFSYLQYVVVISSTVVARILFVPLFQKLAYRYGAARTVLVGTIFLASPPALWTLTDSIPFIIFLQLLSGIGWGLQDLGFALLILERFKAAYRPQAFIMINTLSSCGMLIGSLVGGYLLSIGAFSTSSYHLLFAGTTALRLLVGGMTLFFQGQVRREHFQVFWRIVAVRPTFGVIMRPVLLVAKKNKPRYGRKTKGKESVEDGN